MPVSVHFASAVRLATLLLLIAGPSAAQSPVLENTSGRLSLSPERGSTDFRIDRLLDRSGILEVFGVQRGSRQSLALLTAEDGRASLELPERQTVRLPLKLPVKVSSNGGTVIQYGDALHAMHPSRTDVFWVGRDGRIVAEVRNRFAETAVVALSADGFVAVGGADYFAARGSDGKDAEPDRVVPGQIDMYSPEGKLMWTAEIDAGRRIDELYARAGGQGVAALTASAEAPIHDRTVDVFERGERRGRLVPEIGIVQRAALLGERGLLLVQGNGGHALIDLDAARIVWTQQGAIRLIGPEAAALDENGQVIYLMTGERSAKTSGSRLPLYQWVLTALDAASGKPVGQQRLPEPLPGAMGPIFLQAAGGRVEVRAGGDVLRFDLQM